MPKTKKSSSPFEDKTISLVFNSHFLYPKTEEDYAVLSDLGIPLRTISLDMLPSLKVVAHEYKFVTEQLSALEQKIIPKFKERWKNEIIITDKSIVLTCPRATPEDHRNVAIENLKKWYDRHFIHLEASIKKINGTYRITLYKSSKED